MKKILENKSIFNIFNISAFLILHIFEIIILFIPVTYNNEAYSIINYVMGMDNAFNINYYSLVLLIAICLGVFTFGISLYGLVKQKYNLYLVDNSYHLIITILLFLYQVLYSQSNAVITLLIILILIVCVMCIAYTILFKNAYNSKDNTYEKEIIESTPKIKNSKIAVLIIDILGILMVVVSFFLPLYNLSSNNFYLFMIFTNVTMIYNYICFIIIFLVAAYCFLSFIYHLTFFYNDKKFISKAKSQITGFIAFAIIYFIVGFSMKFYGDYNKIEAKTVAYIPLIIFAILAIVCSFFARSESKPDSNEEKNQNGGNILLLILTLTISLVTVLSLALNVVKIELNGAVSIVGNTSSLSQSINLTGYKLISDSNELSSGFQVISFLLVIMLLTTSLGVIFTLTSYFSKSSYYKSIARYSIVANLTFVLALSISGLYFAIANKINEESISEIIESYTNLVDFSYEYNIKTDLVYALALDVIFIIIVLAKKVIDKTEYNYITIKGASQIEQDKIENEKPQPIFNSNSSDYSSNNEDFDLCPAFTELDNNISAYNQDLAFRITKTGDINDLSSFCKYIVDYAKNSRLHLSYSKETIASFVAGLGASRLQILQGMSGTGKTSLPKIFAEAIYGNCEIIEVESSWKDKNELLGYYNEFSQIYTPKKFTQALYKAALNKEITTFIVLDEMNLSRIEYYFSDFLSLMENEEDKRFIKLTNVKLNHCCNKEIIEYKGLLNSHTIKIPSNVWFVGTANRDESTFVISDKVYDRAFTMNFNSRAPKVRDYDEVLEPHFYSYDMLNNMILQAIENETFDAEENEIITKVEELLAPYNISFGNRILNQIEKFVKVYKACFSNWDVTNDAVEIILLSKVVSKLETKTIEDKDYLINEFESLGLNRCAKFISSLNED